MARQLARQYAGSITFYLLAVLILLLGLVSHR
jgi:hypothetical protein